MSLVLAPILAQALTFYASDRTEVRTRLVPDDVYLDAETRPSVELELATRRTRWSLSYSPTLSALAIGDSNFGEVVLFHSARADAIFRWPRSQLRLSQSGSFGDRNFQVAALSAPDAAQRQTPAPAPEQPPAEAGDGTTPAPAPAPD